MRSSRSPLAMGKQLLESSPLDDQCQEKYKPANPTPARRLAAARTGQRTRARCCTEQRGEQHGRWATGGSSPTRIRRRVGRASGPQDSALLARRTAATGIAQAGRELTYIRTKRRSFGSLPNKEVCHLSPFKKSRRSHPHRPGHHDRGPPRRRQPRDAGRCGAEGDQNSAERAP